MRAIVFATLYWGSPMETTQCRKLNNEKAGPGPWSVQHITLIGRPPYQLPLRNLDAKP